MVDNSTESHSDDRHAAFIGEDYRLYRDRLNWIISRRTKPNGRARVTGDKWKPIGYFPKLYQVFNYMLEYRIRESDREGIRELCVAVDIAKLEMLAAIKEIGEK